MELPRIKKTVSKCSIFFEFFKKSIFWGELLFAFVFCFGTNTQAIAKNITFTEKTVTVNSALTDENLNDIAALAEQLRG